MKNPWGLEGKNPWKKDRKEPPLNKNKKNPWGLSDNKSSVNDDKTHFEEWFDKANDADQQLDKKLKREGHTIKKIINNKESDEERITRLENEIEELKKDESDRQNKKIKKKGGIGCGGLAIILILIFLVGIFSDDNQNKKTKNISLTIEEKINKAHIQYSKRKTGIRSSYLPRVGAIKGEDYRNCIEKEYWFNKITGVKQDSVDFCRWHAELGNYSR